MHHKGVASFYCYAISNYIGGDVVLNTWSVYIHTNKINGKKYVGITSQDPEKRWLGGYGYARHLKFGKAIDKYGWDNFEHCVLHTNLDESEAKAIEINLIKQYNTQNDDYGYNITSGGDGVNGFVHSEASKQKMSQSKSGSKNHNFGKHLSAETRAKIGTANIGNTNAKGCVRSDETREKMSASKMKPVSMFDEGLYVQTFSSAKDAEEELHISRKNISLCCLGKRKHAGGYVWKFA